MSTEQEVIEIIVEKLDVNKDDITREKSFIEDLNADSLETMEIMMAFEERFGFEIPESDSAKIKTVGDAIQYIENHKKN